jgi:hypothetical protein
MVGVSNKDKAGPLVSTLRGAVEAYESKKVKDQVFDITVVYHGSSSPRKSKGTGTQGSDTSMGQHRSMRMRSCMHASMLGLHSRSPMHADFVLNVYVRDETIEGWECFPDGVMELMLFAKEQYQLPKFKERGDIIRLYGVRVRQHACMHE